MVGAMLGSFGFHLRSQGPEHTPVARVVLAGSPRPTSTTVRAGPRASRWGCRLAARILATVPSNIKSPEWLADQAVVVADETGLESTVWDEKALVADGFGGIVAVGRASATPPRLIRLDYAPAKASRKTPLVVLVGKGITFDTGGLSIKPARVDDDHEARHDRAAPWSSRSSVHSPRSAARSG